MKKITCLILAVLLSVTMLAGCGTIITTNHERDMAQVIITVNGEDILKEDFYNIYMNYVYQYYYSYGISPSDSQYASMFQNLAQGILDDLTANKINEQKAVELGYLDGLTEEEKKACREEADKAIDEAIRSNAEALQNAAATPTATPTPTPVPTATPSTTPAPTATPSRTPKPAPTPTPTATEKVIEDKYLDEARQSYMKDLEADGMTMEDIYAQYYMDKAIEKMQEALSKTSVDAVNEEQAKKVFDQMLVDQKKNCETDPTKVESVSGTIVYYPEGYGRYKNLLITIDSEAQAKISALRKEAATAKTESEKDGIAADKKQEYLDTYNAKTKEADDMLAVELTTIVDRANSVLELAKAEGADFDKLILEHGEDSGMFTTDEDGNKEVIKDENAYLVGPKTTTYMEAFTKGALELKNVGDISGLVATDYGYHIILKVSEHSGEVSFDDVKDEIIESEKEKAKNEFLTSQAKTWLEESKVTYYKGRLSDLVELK